jgi:hypothetical protein
MRASYQADSRSTLHGKSIVKEGKVEHQWTASEGMALVNTGIRARRLRKNRYHLTNGALDSIASGCSKRPLVSPTQPRRAKTRHATGRPQRAKRRGGTYQASLEPLASIRCERIGFLPLLDS